MKLSLEEIFTGIVWKVETDDHYPVVAVETRDIENRQTHFSAFNYETGECYFKEISVEEGWFWTIDKVHNAVVLLHSYINESSPEHKGIIALNIKGELAWQQFHKTLLAVSSAGLVIYDSKIQPKILELVNAKDGSLISSNITDYELMSREILVPELIEASEIAHLLPANIAGPVFYQKYDITELVVFHSQTEHLFKQQLTVFQYGEEIMTDILAENIPKLNPEAFFIQRNHVFFIKNEKHGFISYLL